MGNSASNQRRLVQNITNTTLQYSRQACQASSVNDASGSRVIVENSTVTVPVGIFQKASSNASCTMAASLDTNVQNILKSMATQTSTSVSSPIQGTFNDASNADDVRQQITN